LGFHNSDNNFLALSQGLFVNQSWAEVRRELERLIDYERLEVLISNGEPGVEALLRERMRH